MEGVDMNGKTLKVAEYNLTFGASDRYVNVFGFFKYKKNGNLYIIYTDVNTKYELIYYGSSHVKNNNLLSMACKEDDVEIIKEYIYKLTNNQPLDNFEIYSIDDITGVELISSNKLEVKLEVIRKLEELTLPKKEVKEETIEEVKGETKKKKKGLKTILILLIVIILMGGGCFFLTTIINSDKIVKVVTCNKSYQHEKLNATVDESNTYNFTSNDKLVTVNKVSLFTFLNQTDYETFINNGSVYSYMPDNSKDFTPDNDKFTVEYVSEVAVNSSYDGPVEYEELISYYTSKSYSCSERIEE